MAAMEVPSTAKIISPIDISLDVREDSGDSEFLIVLILSILYLLWMGSRLMLLVGMEILHKRFVLLFSHGGLPFFDRRSCCILVVHVCATTHQSKWVFGVVFRWSS